jgi:hypothetical protein
MNWSERARGAAIVLSTGEERQDESLTAQLIRDIHEVFTTSDADALKTSDLLDGLYVIEESPWGDWYGKTLSAHGLSKLLKTYRIKTMPVWVDGKTVRGYKLDQFADAYSRVVSVRSVSGVRPEARSQAVPNAPNSPNASGTENNEICVECGLAPRVGGSLYCTAHGGRNKAEQFEHPGEALEALLDAFPDAAEAADNGPPWRTQSQGRFGVVQIRDVPDDGRSATGAKGAA